MRIIDISTPIDASQWEIDPVSHQILSAADGAQHMAEGMRTRYGIDFDTSMLPDGEMLTLDTLTLTTHTGTHVDAPSHYGSRTTYGTGVPRTIDELPLDWFVGPGLVLDASDRPVGRVDATWAYGEFSRLGREPSPGDIVLVRTGADARVGTPSYFEQFVGLDDTAVDLLLDFGVRVIGTDAFSLDAPFGYMLREFERTGDPGGLWPAHFVGRRREYCQIERLGQLDTLPAHGFTVQCFPVKIAGAGAGWTRAVALLQ